MRTHPHNKLLVSRPGTNVEGATVSLTVAINMLNTTTKSTDVNSVLMCAGNAIQESAMLLLRSAMQEPKPTKNYTSVSTHGISVDNACADTKNV